jgi:serine/threonine protein phosphatase 1
MKKTNRTLVIGDIHGALKALEQVLDRCNYNSKKDTLIFLGDYVDGWSQSSELIEYLILLKEANSNIIFLRGNHDKWCEDWLKTGVRELMWVSQGGQSTLESYMRTQYMVGDRHRDFFRSLHNYYIDDKNRGFVHGGFVSKKGLGHDPYQSDYYWDRDLWELAVAHDKEKPEIKEKHDQYFRPNPFRMYRHEEIYIGHTTTNAWKIKPTYKEYKDDNQPKNGPIIVPMNRCNMWNLDTGCGYHGKLTIMDIDSKQYWQSDYVKDLYPNELGRG